MSIKKAGNVRTSANVVTAARDVLALIEADGFDMVPNFAPREGHIYTVTRAISARINQNFDGFPSEELKVSYKTFLGKPCFVNHANDDPTRARGRVVGARYAEDGNDKYIQVIQEANAQKYPLLAKEIIEGGIDAVSMGCVAERTICSFCGNEASDMFDMCEHVLRFKGQVLSRRNEKTGAYEDIQVYEECRKIGFFELSWVFDPADETALHSKVIAAGKKTAAEPTVKCDFPGCAQVAQVNAAVAPAGWQHVAGDDAIYDFCSPQHRASFLAANPAWREANLSKKAFGEVEAPEWVDTLRDEEDEQENHQYVQSIPELEDPDFDKNKEVEHVEEKDDRDKSDDKADESDDKKEASMKKTARRTALHRRAAAMEDPTIRTASAPPQVQQFVDFLKNQGQDPWGLMDDQEELDDWLAGYINGSPSASVDDYDTILDYISSYEFSGTTASRKTAATGYVCKECGGPSPMGVGYAADGEAAQQASEGLTSCACGYSQKTASRTAGVNTNDIRVGDIITYNDGGRSYEMTVWQITPPGSAGTSYAHGPKIWAHIRPGGYGISFDRGSYQYQNVSDMVRRASKRTASLTWYKVTDDLLGDGFSTWDVSGTPPAGPQGQIVKMNDGRISWYIEDAYSGFDYASGYATSMEDAKSAAEAALKATTAGLHMALSNDGWGDLLGEGWENEHSNPAKRQLSDNWDIGWPRSTYSGPGGTGYIDSDPSGSAWVWSAGGQQGSAPDNYAAMYAVEDALRHYGKRDAGNRPTSVQEHVTRRNTTGGNAMGRTRTRRADQSRNDQGVAEDAFITQTPPAEPVETAEGEEVHNTEQNLVAHRRAFARFSAYVASRFGGNLRTASTGDIRKWARSFARDTDTRVASLYPTLGKVLEAARTASDDDDAPKGDKASDENKAKAKDSDDKDDDDSDKKESRRRTLARRRRLAGEKPDFLKKDDDDDDDDKKDDKKESRRRAERNRRRADTSLEVASPDGRVDVERPTADTTDDEAQASQFDKGDFGDNAGDDLAKPDLSTDQNWAPGDGKKSGARAVMASTSQAVRLAECYIKASIATEAQKWDLVAQFEKTTRATVRDRIALMDRISEANPTSARAKTAGVTRGSAVRSAIPQGLASMAQAPREASLGDDSDPANDMLLWMK